jgi:hypothetical protein
LDDSTAVTHGSGIVSKVSAFAQAPIGSTATTLAESNSGNQLGSSGFNGTNNDSYAFATEVPNHSLVTSFLNANSNIETALGNGTVFGLATEGASYSTTARRFTHLHKHNRLDSRYHRAVGSPHCRPDQ